MTMEDKHPHEGEHRYMSIKEFRELGFLQEVNRVFLHPLGLALEVQVPEDGSDEYLSGVWDYRDDPEGMTYAPGTIEEPKIQRVEEERLRHMEARLRLFGRDTIVQEVDQ